MKQDLHVHPEKSCKSCLKTATEQVRHLYKERSAITPKTWLKLPCKRTKSIPIQIIVVTGVERRPWIGGPTQQELPFDVGS